MKLVAYAFAAATFIGASCPNPVVPPPDVVTDSSAPPDCRCKPCPVLDASCPIVLDAAPPAPNVDAAPPAPPPKPSCQTACDSMKAAGCKEANFSRCAELLCKFNADPQFIHYDVACLTSATSPAGIRACGMSCTQ